MFPRLTALALRAYPLQFGRGALFRRLCLEGAVNDHLASMPNPIRMKEGFHLFTFERDFTSLWFRQFGDYEADVRRTICRLLPAGSVFVDVGASFGIHSVGVAVQRPDVHVVAFEPNPASFSLLSRSAEFNGLSSRIRCFAAALSNVAADVDFVQNPNNSGDSFIATSAGEVGLLPKRVSSVPLDDFSPLREWMTAADLKIGCVKIDVQGAEILVLRGMASTLREHQPAIVLECEEACLARYGHSPSDLFDTLADLGYRVSEKIDHKNVLARPDGKSVAGSDA